ncbi:hypothetical protein M431DRAFT_82244 [Trichoderma harzianum CBS 226.95]|uniref:CBS domain-containing protein n=1 Tax=Trichoderma harzianum CBS 226.95 TaxID=983964 RepID=A0A2T4AEG2_TRIHA|nr:hypothetical protein M431DRAFT_82244 [Trichoderma harzianum CBS 226.95]PTB55480.1 hypothetical protein M431DRAFT_82244 [Trichoderma harzianum CBS 226.95]
MVNASRGNNPSRNQPRSTTPFNNGPAVASSGIPRPVLDAQQQPNESSASLSASRQKQSKRDEAIRRKLESDLSKKKTLTGRSRQIRRAPPGTVLALKPSQALQIKPATTVSEAAQLMAAKREDCVLVTDDEDRIAGIFTAKDLAFRVVGAGLKAANVTIAEIMTKNPLCARTDTSATDALDLMVRKGFRHLPVMDENQDISGVLDITKCFYDAMEKLERAYSSSRKLYDALEGVQSELGASQPQQIIQYVEALRSKMSGPTLESVLNGIPPTTVSVRTSVKEAAAMMKENHTTAVLVQDQGAITGIFTSKDVVLRVIAPGLDPANCSVVRVMTPHPDFAPMDMTIQAALRKMHDGHYLNLPVMNDGGEIVGMVDVLKLTYATLEQINTMSSDNGEGPAWNKFWLSIDHETESMVSGDGSHSHHHAHHSRMMSPEANRLGDSVAPNDSASHIGLDSPPHSIAPEVTTADVPFAFKFKAPSGRVHRLQVVASQGIEAFVHAVASKLGSELDSIGGMPDVLEGRIDGPGFALSYMDNEGDTVSITTDNDLLEAILLARQAHLEKVDLFVHDSEKPPTTPSLDTLPTPVSSSTGLRERRRAYEEEESESEEEESEEEEEQRPARRSRRSRTIVHQEQIIAGVPNDLLLPGAIVTLAVVIIGVFTIARATSRWSKTNAAMNVQSAAVRHGRRALASPLPRAVLRQLSTEVKTTTASASTSTSNGPAQAWPAPQSAAAPPKIVSSAKKKQKIVEEYAEFQRIQKNTRSLGSKLEKRYVPTEIISNPPRPEDVTLELLMASQTHMGHNTSLWNPANSRYIYGVRQGIHIISLETTAAHLRRAARVVEEVAYRGGVILFVGTRKGQMEIVTKASELAGAYHLFTKWIPGSITNRDVILRTQGMKVVDHLDKELDGFDMFKGTARPILPDLVVCLNPLENYTLLYECGLKNIPTIGVIDTNTDPSWVTYTIPANDDSLRSMALVAGVLGRAGEAGQKRRLQDAASGNISWSTSPELSRHMRKEVQAAVLKRKEVMGRMQANIQGFTDEEMKLLRSQYLGEQQDEVTEDDLVNMMGETVAAEASTEKAAPSGETVGARLGSIEAQLKSLQKNAVEIEQAVRGSV